MKKKIKLFILGILITVFGLYFISNSTNVYAETSYDEISSNSFVNQNCYVNQSIASLSENELPINPNQVYKPTFYEAYQDSYAIQYNYSSLYTTLNTASISLKTNYSNGEYHIYTNNIDVYESNSAYHLKLSQISAITLTHKGQYVQGHALRYINYIASSSTNKLTLKNKNFEYVLLKYTEYSVGPNLPCGREVKASNGDSFVTEAYCYLIAKVTFANKDFQNNKKYIISNPLELGNYCNAYKCDEANPTNPTTLYSNSSLNDEGKYLMKTFYSDGSIDKTFYIYLITDNTFSICRSDGNKIDSEYPTNDTTVYLKFDTKLEKKFINEIVDTITLDGQTYEGSTKSNFINGEGLAVATTNQIISCQINGGFFKSSLDGSDKYEFTIDTKSPELNLESANNYGCSQNDNNFLFYGSVNISFTEGTLKLNGSEYTKDIITEEGTYKLELTDSAGNTTTKNLYIQKLDYLKAVYIKASKETTSENIFEEPTVATYSQQIKFIGYDSITIDGITFGVTYTLKLDEVEYEKNTPIIEEGKHTFSIVYSTGYKTSYQFTIDRTAPSLNKNYLQSQGYNQEICWYNTENENGVTYSFSYYKSDESEKIGVYQYSLKRETTYFTLIIPYSSNWRTTSLDQIDTSFKNKDQINLDTISTYDTYDGDDYIYIYRNPATDGYIAYFRWTNYQNALHKIVEKSITPQYKFKSNTYNPYPDSNYQYYFTYKENNIDYPLFYLNSEYKFTQGQSEATSINYEIYNALTNQIIFPGSNSSNPKINEKGLYKIIETDLAGNSTIYFISYNNETPYADIENLDNVLITIEEKNLKAPFIVKPGIPFDDYNSSEYSIISYKYNGEQYYYNCYDNLTNEYNPLVCSNDGIYEFTIYSIYTNHSIKYTVKLYQKEIIDEISYELDGDEAQTGLLVKFSLEDAIQSKQITQINIFKDDNQLYGSTDSNGTEIKITSSNEYEFYFNTSGIYQIEIIELCGHKISKEFNLYIGSPSGFLYKNILDSSGAHEEKIEEEYVYHNNIVYFRWNPNKTSYTATITNLKTGSSSVYTNGEKIQTEGEYKIILINGDKNKEYFITIDKTAPSGFIIDSLKTNESGFILDNNGNVTTQKITSNNYISGNRDGIKLSCLESDVKAKLLSGEVIELDTYLKGTTNTEITYTIILYDRAGNETVYNLKLDYKMAEIKILCGSKQISNYSYVNQAFRFVCDEEVIITDLSKNTTIPLNKKISYEFTDKIMEYNFKIEDSYNNIASYTIYFDNTTPMIRLEHLSTDGTITEINSKATINNAFIISWNESKNYTVTISYTNEYGFQQIPISNGDIINTELKPSSLKLNDKKYTITVTNLAGTEQIYYVYLCNTFLGCSVYLGTKLQDSTIKDFITNKSVKFIFYDATATINGNEYKSNTKIEEDGVYELQITDIYNNSYIYTFTIDTLPAPVEIISTTNIIENGTNGDVILRIEEDAKIYLLNNEIKTEYPKDFIYSNEGLYKFEIIDKANNITNISFVIDKTAPTFEITGFPTNQNITKENVKFTWDEPNVKATINGTVYKSNTKIEEDGVYELILSDIYGNQAIFNFEIDSKMIEYTLHGINEQLYSNDYAYIDFDNSKIKAKIIYESEEKDYFSETLIDEGEYKVILISKEITDKKVEISFIIDKTAPTLELRTISSTGFIFENDSYYTNNTFIASYDSTQNTCSIDNGSTTIEYLSEKQIKEPGNYKLTLTDLAGNSTIYFVIIDKSDISFNLLNENNENLNYKLNETSAATQTNYYNTSIKLVLPEGSKATIDNQDYISDTLITAEGEYTLNLTNKLGTVSTFKFIIDKTAPVINLNVNSEFKTCDSVKIIVDEKNNYELYINDVKKTYYTITDNGTYNIICKDVAGNISEVSFEILNRNIKDYISLEQDESLYTINLKIEELEDIAIYVDNIEVESLDSYTIPGKHQLEIKDAYGNSFKTTFTINEPKAPSYIFNNVMTYVLIGLISILIIVFIIRKTKSSKKNPYFKG